MLKFSTANTPKLEPKSPPGPLACSTIYFLLTSRSLQPTKRLAEVNARTKQHLIMQNKANFRRAANDCNLSSNKHLRRKPTPGGPKKQSQFKTNWQKGRDRQTSPNTSYQFRGTLLRAYKAPLAGVPPLQAPRAHKTIPFMQNKANFRSPDNDCNLSHNKHLRTQITSASPKKQSQFPQKAKTSASQVCTKVYENKARWSFCRCDSRPSCFGYGLAGGGTIAGFFL